MNKLDNIATALASGRASVTKAKAPKKRRAAKAPKKRVGLTDLGSTEPPWLAGTPLDYLLRHGGWTPRERAIALKYHENARMFDYFRDGGELRSRMSPSRAVAWLRSHYKGSDSEGIGVALNGKPLRQKRTAKPRAPKKRTATPARNRRHPLQDFQNYLTPQGLRIASPGEHGGTMAGWKGQQYRVVTLESGPYTPKAKKPRAPRPIDHAAVHELRLYAENTGELYAMHQAIVAHMQRKVTRGSYDPTKAPKAWVPWFARAAKMYERENGPLAKPIAPVVRAAATEYAPLALRD
jgi:hypothetical protein